MRCLRVTSSSLSEELLISSRNSLIETFTSSCSVLLRLLLYMSASPSMAFLEIWRRPLWYSRPGQLIVLSSLSVAEMRHCVQRESDSAHIAEENCWHQRNVLRAKHAPLRIACCWDCCCVAESLCGWKNRRHKQTCKKDQHVAQISENETERIGRGIQNQIHAGGKAGLESGTTCQQCLNSTRVPRW